MRTINKLAIKEFMSSNIRRILITSSHIGFIAAFIITPILIHYNIIDKIIGNVIIEKPIVILLIGLFVEIVILAGFSTIEDKKVISSKYYSINVTIGLLVLAIIVLEFIFVEFLWKVLLIDYGCIKII